MGVTRVVSPKENDRPGVRGPSDPPCTP